MLLARFQLRKAPTLRKKTTQIRKKLKLQKNKIKQNCFKASFFITSVSIKVLDACYFCFLMTQVAYIQLFAWQEEGQKEKGKTCCMSCIHVRVILDQILEKQDFSYTSVWTTCKNVAHPLACPSFRLSRSTTLKCVQGFLSCMHLCCPVMKSRHSPLPYPQRVKIDVPFLPNNMHHTKTNNLKK